MKKILTITTGGTIFQKSINGKMEIVINTNDLIKKSNFKEKVDFFHIEKRSGAEMTFETIILLRDKIISESNNYDGFVILTGTDSMEEVAFALDLLIDLNKPIVITGSMKPSDVLGYDGFSNYSESLNISISKEASNKGVLLYLNNKIHLARYVNKFDSALIESFTSHPGSIGEVRCGKVIFYYEINKKSLTYNNLNLKKLYSINIPIWK